MKHALIISGGEYACTCGGARGSYAAVSRHIVENEGLTPVLEPSLRSRGFPQGIVIGTVPADDDFDEGDITKAHYLPNEPRRPASAVGADPDPVVLPPTPGIFERPRSIAEAFQDMLRIAYQAGVASAATGEIFETWYQREVLQ